MAASTVVISIGEVFEGPRVTAYAETDDGIITIKNITSEDGSRMVTICEGTHNGMDVMGTTTNERGRVIITNPEYKIRGEIVRR